MRNRGRHDRSKRARPAATPPAATAGVRWVCALAPLAIAAASAPSPPVAADPVRELSPIASPHVLRAREAVPGSAEAVLRRFVDHHSALRYDLALAAAEELIEAAPGSAIAHYNHACVLARLRRADAAIDALDRAIGAGWRHEAHAAIDPDLDPLRADPRFDALLQRMTALVAAERIAPAPLRTDPIEAVAAELRQRVDALLERYGVPGAAVCVLRGGRIAWTGAFGVASVADGTPMTGETRYALRAPRDLVALIAGARLHEESRLDLADVLLRGDEMLVRSRGAGAWRVSRPRGAATAFGRAHQHDPLPLPPGVVAAPALDRWPRPAERTEMSDMLRAAVELAARDEFAAHCRRRVLEPAGLSHTAIATRTGARTPDEAGPAPPPIGAGHSQLGTPIPADPVAWSCTTTAVDLARLVEVALGARPDVLKAPGTDLIAGAAELELFRLGLPLWGEETASGLRIQVAGADDGAGCLLRWYPEHGCGVVIVFNGECGPDAALRIAHAALGGD